VLAPVADKPRAVARLRALAVAENARRTLVVVQMVAGARYSLHSPGLRCGFPHDQALRL
jgi:hypothetical protein